MHVLAALAAEAKANDVRLFANVAMLNALAGSKRLYQLLMAGHDGGSIIAAWGDEVAQFKALRAKYLLY
jgi:uncharacterized protein YbbC (DUF1343 family)